MGLRVAHHLTSPNVLDYIELSDEYSIVELRVTQAMVGQNLKELNVRARFGCNVMAIKRGTKMNISPSSTDRLTEGDILVVVGEKNDLTKMELAYAEG
ncbi:Ktr system potassium uptake protein A [compost metagenome]